MISIIFIGSLLGLSAGIAPGPLLMLVISETLQHDIKAGIKVALVPLLTDLPIIMLALFLSTTLTELNYILGSISIVGGCFILYLAYNNLCIEAVELDEQEIKNPGSLIKGMLANVLSPHPYLFWLTVGAPIVSKTMNNNFFIALLFILSFYFCLIGSKITLAILAGKSKSFLAGAPYIYTMKFLGIILCFFAIMLFYDGLVLLS
ncbi:MAG: LysE family translocator [Proteobacteria bacterium]|nr:LysE family translocator [Pseudomonadota bacterium]NOG59550.1 LysE family translocator [Pseudomonadota bacterium]